MSYIDSGALEAYQWIKAGIVSAWTMEQLDEMDWRFVRDYVEIARIDAEIQNQKNGGGGGFEAMDDLGPVDQAERSEIAALAGFSKAN